LEEKAVASLTPKWKGKTASQLFESLDFYRDIIKGSKNMFFYLYLHKLRICIK